jgi:hypothetical protein
MAFLLLDRAVSAVMPTDILPSRKQLVKAVIYIAELKLLLMKLVFCTCLLLLLVLEPQAQTNVLPASGRVGIGTTNPQQSLHVKGDVRIERFSGGNNYILFSGDNAGNYITAADPATNMKNLYIRVSPTGDNATDRHLFFQTGKVNGAFQTRLYINGNGNVGIGTTTPREKLAVNGNIRAKEIKVETANWPDYVFKDGYELKSLAETEKYIKDNGHLPDIPKAEEAETEGIALGEMNKLLLKKIEELTLHAIEQQKRIKKLEAQVFENSKD